MSIVINEFEIVTDARPPQPAAPSDRGGGEQSAAQAPAVAPPRPEEIVRIVERQTARLLRLRAD